MKLRALILEDEGDWQSRILRVLKKKVANFSTIYFDKRYIEQAHKIDDKLIYKLNNDFFHLAIIDFDLVDSKNGNAAIEELTKRDLIRKTKIILHTGKLERDKHEHKSLKKGVFSFVLKTDKVPNSDEMKLSFDINRALEIIEHEEFGQLVSKRAEATVPHYLKRKGAMKKLSKGILVDKVMLLSDLANSTEFFEWVSDNGGDGGSLILREIIADLLGYQATIIDSFGGEVDKFYGDEIRAFFGDSFKESFSEEDEAYFNNIAVKASIKIIRDFPKKLEKWINRVRKDSKLRPSVLPYPRIYLHYERVLWAIFGSKKHRDLTIWTKNVAILHRLPEIIRKNNPCYITNMNPNHDPLGEIYLTHSVKEKIDPSFYFCRHYENISLRKIDKPKVTIYSLNLHDALKCKECDKKVILVNGGKN